MVSTNNDGSLFASSIARLFNAPLDSHEAEALGVSTIGSSEAIILAVLAAKRAWMIKRKAQGKPTDKPNIVMVGIHLPLYTPGG